MRPSAHDRRRVAEHAVDGLDDRGRRLRVGRGQRARERADVARRELVEQRAGVRIGRALDHDLDAHHLRVALERPDRAAHERAQLGLVARVRPARFDWVASREVGGPLEERGGVEVLLRSEVAVDRGQRHAGLLRDVAHLDRVVLPAVLQERDRGADDPVAPLLLPARERGGVGVDGDDRG